MKRLLHILICTLALLSSLNAKGQQKAQIMHYKVVGKDTVFVDQLPASRVWPRKSDMSSKEWRQYYKLVFNFSKTYPYALLGARLVTQADREIEEKGMNKVQREKYLAGVQRQLLKDFDKSIRNMTISQGKLLVRLIDREIGKSSYSIVKDYRSSIAAGFWQGIAKLFGQDLKTPYDPDGEDRKTEELVEIWEEGQFDDLYFTIFGEFPSHKDIPSKYR